MNSGQATLMKLQKDMETVYQELQDSENLKQEAYQKKQKISTKSAENELVKKELDLVADEDKVYKMVGPALVSEPASEAKAHVEKRLKLFNDQIGKIDKEIGELENKSEEKRVRFLKIRQVFTQILQSAQMGMAPKDKS